MRQFFQNILLVTVSALGFVSNASAADLPVKAPVMAPVIVPAYN
jgi:hypothetical protein